MRSRLAAVAVLLSIALLAVPTAAASGEPWATEPCILTGLGCFVLELAEAVTARVMACVQDLDCVG